MKGDRVTIGSEAERTMVLTRESATERHASALAAVQQSHYKRGKRIGIVIGSASTFLLMIALVTAVGVMAKVI